MNPVKIIFTTILYLTFNCAYTKETKEITPFKIHKIQLDYSNVYLVNYNEKLIVIDTGHEKDFLKFEQDLLDWNYNWKDIKLVILTHGHEDHAGAGKLFQSKGIPIMAGLDDKPLLNQGENDSLCPTNDQAKKMLAEFQNQKYSSFDANHYIESNQTLNLKEFFGFPILVRHTGNHTPGSLTIEIPSIKTFFSGDLIRGDGPFQSSRGAIHFYQCNLKENQEKLKNILENSNAEIFFTGHFGPISRKEVLSVIQELEKELN
jgi:hydroxyacylglutathione hydrolase